MKPRSEGEQEGGSKKKHGQDSKHILSPPLLLILPSKRSTGSHFCCLQRKAGERIGDMKVGKLSDAILSSMLPANATCLMPPTKWSRTACACNFTMFRYSWIVAEVKPYVDFADLIPQLPLNSVGDNQARKSIISTGYQENLLISKNH